MGPMNSIRYIYFEIFAHLVMPLISHCKILKLFSDKHDNIGGLDFLLLQIANSISPQVNT